MTTKQITLTLAILGTVGTAMLTIAGTLSPAWAAFVGALGAGCYGVARSIQKRLAGDEWKSWLRTTEAWGTLLAIAAPSVAALAGVLPAKQAVAAAGVAAAMLVLARKLQGQVPPSSGTPCWLVFILATATIVTVVGAAQAAESQFGGCFAGGQLCAGPSATVTVGEYSLAGKFSGGVNPGIGYGLTYAPDRWYATGLAGYLAFSVGGSRPNSARPALMLSFANYLRLGLGLAVTEQDTGTLKQWSLLFGLGVDVGGTPTYTGRNL